MTFFSVWNIALVLGAVCFVVWALLRTVSKSIVRDVKFLYDLAPIMLNAKIASFKSMFSVVDMFQATVKRQPNQVSIDHVGGKRYTWSEVDRRSNQFAHALRKSVAQGDCVALMMENRPEFIFTWLACMKLGSPVAMINSNLEGRSLHHCLSVSQAKVFVVGAEVAQQVANLDDPIDGMYFIQGGDSPANDCGIKWYPLAVSNASQGVTPRAWRSDVTVISPMCYIYTSGTTGFPKASVVKHLRFYMASHIFSQVYHVKPSDVLYCCLPAYHSAGGMLGIGSTWQNGSRLVLRRKFSTTNFWKDVREHGCTVIQYIGELCRYLLSSPHTSLDSSHKVWLAVGNGMRPDVWERFQKRFGIERIGEFYGSTEGNCTLFNNQNKPKAVGYLPDLVRLAYPVRLCRFDIQKEELVRGPDGFCVESKPDEEGELLGKIVQSNPTRQFDGYTNDESTKKKIAHNVFCKGDSWFRSGDLLRRDADGFFYFVDRIGDTFRWRGENVATGEVASVLSDIDGVDEVNVYGVVVPQHDGKAGMATIVSKQSLDWSTIYEQLQRDLPRYAQPLFVRVRKEMVVTSTLKHKKGDLVKEGFDPDKVDEPLFFRDDAKKTFVKLDKALFDDICSGKKRV